MKQMLVGAVSWLTPGPRQLDSEAVKNFFNRHEQAPDPLVFDSRSEGYLDQAISVFEQFEYLGFILDLGSGPGTLYEALIAAGIQLSGYLGLDANVKRKRIGPNAWIDEADFNGPVEFGQIEGPLTVASVNTLCYMEPISSIPLLSKLAHRPQTRLVVVLPWPGLFWDKHFDGVAPVYRTPKSLAADLGSIGWRSKEVVISYLIRVGPIALLPLSYSMAFVTERASAP